MRLNPVLLSRLREEHCIRREEGDLGAGTETDKDRDDRSLLLVTATGFRRKSAP